MKTSLNWVAGQYHFPFKYSLPLDSLFIGEGSYKKVKAMSETLQLRSVGPNIWTIPHLILKEGKSEGYYF